MKLSSEQKRLGKVIENDRLTIGSDMSELIEFDLKNLLNNYFNLSGNVKLGITALKDCYLITVTASASGVKPFGTVK